MATEHLPRAGTLPKSRLIGRRFRRVGCIDRGGFDRAGNRIGQLHLRVESRVDLDAPVSSISSTGATSPVSATVQAAEWRTLAEFMSIAW